MKQEKPKVEQLIENVFSVNCDELNLHFKNTKDKAVWYRFNHATRTMYMPGVDVLRVNQAEVSRALGAAETLLTLGPDAPEFNWTDLNLSWYHDEWLIISFLKQMANQEKELLVACDIETRDLSWDNNKLLSIGFATGPDTCVALSNIPQNLYPLLSKALTNPNVRYAWHNGKFDCTRLKYICGVDARVDEDTELKHYVQVSETKGTHKLKMLGPIYLQAPQWDDELEKFKKEWCRKHNITLKQFKYDMIPVDILIPYMQRDCLATYRLIDVLDRLKEPGTDWIYRKLIEATNVFVDLELQGVMLDQEHVKTIEKELRDELEDANKQVSTGVSYFWDPVQYARDTSAKFVEAFNINSPKQLNWLLSKAVGKQLASTDAATIAELTEDADAYPQHTRDLLKGIARTRKASKYLDTYVVAMRKNMCKDGKVRGSYLLHGTETGRLSSKDPNMQNIPRNKKIKKIFKASPGYKLLQMDYSQAELRVLGVLSKDEFLINSYVEDKDLHSNVALKIFGPGFTDEQRTQCKTINFGK